MSVSSASELVELQARVIIIKSYVQFLLLESATMPQYHFVIEAHLSKLQAQIRELESLVTRLCGETMPQAHSSKRLHQGVYLDG